MPIYRLWSKHDFNFKPSCKPSGRTLAVGKGVPSAVTLRVFSNLDSYGMKGGMRVAIIHTDQRARRIMELGIGVAQGKGWQVAMFDEESAAKEWLRQTSQG